MVDRFVSESKQLDESHMLFFKRIILGAFGTLTRAKHLRKSSGRVNIEENSREFHRSSPRGVTYGCNFASKFPKSVCYSPLNRGFIALVTQVQHVFFPNVWKNDSKVLVPFLLDREAYGKVSTHDPNLRLNTV